MFKNSKTNLQKLFRWLYASLAEYNKKHLDTASFPLGTSQVTCNFFPALQ